MDDLMDVEMAVLDRYANAARAPQASLCCPTRYDPALLEAIPEEVLERDYGCGDPTAHLRPGDVVLDLGSGSGKHCFMAGQVVGPSGWVVGIDAHQEMLALARRAAPQVAQHVGYANVWFRRARIQDLALDLDDLDAWLAAHPVRNASDLARLDAECARLRATAPVVADESVDVVISNCVLNLVRPEDKQRMFREIHRVLRPGGRAIISDIVSDEDVPAHLRRDPELWSGCISGAFREDAFLEAFAEAGLYGIGTLERQPGPWRTVEGIEFRSVTVAAYKGKEGPCLDQGHAVIYRGPFSRVEDDDGHVIERGVPTAVCGKTFGILTREPYAPHFHPVPPRTPVPREEASRFPCGGGPVQRDPRETKGDGDVATCESMPENGSGTLRSGCC